MYNVLSQLYNYQAELNIWQCDTPKIFNYSDGDEIEDRLYTILNQVKDKSILSDELQTFQKDWATTYHLSASRANLLRPIEKTLLKDATVLELGCGCGGITRYLAETCAHVCSVEGSQRRASITALRCQDLTNITIISDSIYDLSPNIGSFDVVTLIGVLEYARLFGGEYAETRLLKKACSFLKPGGALIVAIENKLGLKYIAGIPEEHLGTSWTGVMDGYTSDGIVTFNRKELEDLLIQTGFSHLQQFIPLPDYKLPITVLHPEGVVAEEKEFQRAPLIAASSRSFEEKPLFNIQQVWKGICNTNMLANMADSLCFIAWNTYESDKTIHSWPKNILASHYGTFIQKQYAKETQFIRSDDGIQVLRRHLIPGLQKPNAIFSQLLEEEPYIKGELLIEKMRQLMVKYNWTIEQIAAVLQPWFSWLYSQCIPGTTDLPAKLQDIAPFNVVLDKDGTINPIDIEWTSIQSIPLLTMLVRTLSSTFIRIGQVAPPATNVPLKIIPLLHQVICILYKPISMDSIHAAWEDTQNKVTCYLGVDCPWEIMLHAELSVIPNMPLSMIQSLKTDLCSLSEENKNLREELASCYNSRSWKITKPLRFCSNKLHNYRVIIKNFFTFNILLFMTITY